MSAESFIENADEITKDEQFSTMQNEGGGGFIYNIITEIIYSPLNLLLVLLISILIYKIIRGRFDLPHSHEAQETIPLPKWRRDFTLRELKPFDGSRADGRVLVAVNGSVYDVTKGKRFYGPGGPYAAFGGRDASRGLATFSVTTNDTIEYDDLSDLNSMEMESVREWEMQFKEKYDLVGKLLKPGEQATNYSDEDDDNIADVADVKIIEENESETTDIENIGDGNDKMGEVINHTLLNDQSSIKKRTVVVNTPNQK